VLFDFMGPGDVLDLLISVSTHPSMFNDSMWGQDHSAPLRRRHSAGMDRSASSRRRDAPSAAAISSAGVTSYRWSSAG
jgi:hypothetical protein